MEINERLRALREDHDKTLTDVAEYLGTTYQYYQKYEKGKHEVPVRVIKRLCLYYNVSADYILDLPPTLEKPSR